MSKAVPGMIERLGGEVEAMAGRSVRDQVLTGSEAITAKTGGAEIAHMSIPSRAVAVGLFFLLSILSGIWLSRSGRPLNVGISTVHKLISLAAGIYLLATVYRRSQLVPLSGSEWIAVVATGLCFLAMVASGGFLSSEKPVPVALLRVHQVVPALTAISTAATLYLLLGR